MKFKEVFGNTFLLLSSIYLPLVFYSAFEYFSPSNLSRIMRDRILNEDINQKIEAVKSGYIPTYLPNKLLGHENKLKVYPVGSLPQEESYWCNEGYGLIKYKTDRFGLRNSEKKWEFINNQSNIFVVGDSFINGACVKDDETIPTNIERFTNLNTLNLGMGDNSPYEYMALLSSLVNPLIQNSKTKNYIILTFYFNDNIQRNIEKEKLLDSITPILDTSKKKINPTEFYINNIKTFIKDNYPNTPSEIISEIKKIEKVWNKFNNSAFYNVSTLYPIRSRIGLRGKVISNISSKTLIENHSHNPSQKSIIMLSEICKTPCQPYVAYLPKRFFVWHNSKSYFPYKQELKKISNSLGINFIDGDEVIDIYNKNDWAPQGTHLSIEGYKKMAEFMSKKIME